MPRSAVLSRAQKPIEGCCTKNLSQGVLWAPTSGYEIPTTMHIGTQAWFPDHSRGGHCTNDTVLFSSKPSTKADESRKLLQYMVEILRHNRILLLEDVAAKRLHLRQEWIAMPAIRLRNVDPKSITPGTFDCNVASSISCRVLGDDKGGPRLCLWGPMKSDTTGKWPRILYTFLLRHRPRCQDPTAKPCFHVCAKSRTLLNLCKAAAMFI
jgi:hypothetical protein